ncbi:MAG: hypothetical protein AAB520_02385, partial [Patescibacteria group bacterium]
MSKSRKIKFSRSKISIALVALAGIVVSLFALGVVSVPTVTTGATPTPTVFGGVLRNQAGEGW